MEQGSAMGPQGIPGPTAPGGFGTPAGPGPAGLPLTSPGMLAPGMHPGMHPGMMAPGMMHPGMPPGMMAPGMMPPGMMAPGMMRPGMQGPFLAPGGVPESVAAPGVPHRVLPLEESYIENILRLNLGRSATFYMTFENNAKWNAMVFKGRIEAAGRDHIIISDPQTGKRFLLLMVNVDYVEFDEPLRYVPPAMPGMVAMPGMAAVPPRQ